MDKSQDRATSTTVRTSVSFTCGDASGSQLGGALVFDPADAYAVAMHLEARSGLVVWTFARELLFGGLYEPVGDGDVQVWPCLSENGSAVVIVELSSPEGMALIQAPARAVHDFLARTHEIVPVGEEGRHLPIDSLITRLLTID